MYLSQQDSSQETSGESIKHGIFVLDRHRSTMLGSGRDKAMAVHQTKKDTAEAKLQKLQAQLYGKQTAINSSGNFSFKATTDLPRINSTTQTSDISYLQQSLRKIFILSFLAVALQFLLFYLEQNHYINLNFLNLS